MSDFEFLIELEEDTLSLASRVARLCRGGELIILEGQLGAGKTFFAGGIRERLDWRRMSLSFRRPLILSSRMTRHRLWNTQISTAFNTGKKYLNRGLRERRDELAVLLVEWGSRFAHELGGDALLLEFSLSPRKVRVSATGPDATRLLSQLLESVREHG